MSEIQETDIAMRVVAVIGGIVAIIESILVMVGIGILPYNFEIIGGVISLICAFLVALLGVRPIHYTPTFLGILGVGLIICAALIGGIIVLLATFIGTIS